MRNRMHDNARPGHLYGIGMDNDDGHKRITQAEQFSVFGGSRETHERLTVTFIKAFESLKQQGKRLEHTEPHELNEIIKKAIEEL